MYDFVADNNCHFYFGILGHKMDLEDCLSHKAMPNTVALYYENVMIVRIWYIVCGISLHSPFVLSKPRTNINVMCY